MICARVSDVGLQEEAVHLGVDVLDRDLESVEGSGFGDLDFLHEPDGEILEDDSVGGGEEGQDVSEEVLLVGGQGFELTNVLREIDFLGGPERRFGFLVHLPDLRVLDRKHTEPVRVRSENRLFLVDRHFWVCMYVYVY